VNYDPKADCYVLLGVLDTADLAEIRKAYRARIQQAHPDRSTGSTAAAAALNVAHDVLSDPKNRAAYDDARHHHFAAVAAAAEAKAAAKAARASKARARASAAVGRKGPRQAVGIVRKASPPSPPDAVKFAVDNLMQSLQSKQYGKALGWFLLGAVALDAGQRRPHGRRPTRRRPR
jgi:curved DNA-binding protein CbpA